ncbi:hypothetical protein B566_EDAN004876 [Ephemera danica]|nr:hypothetical protein B566_EDAN004876 [Ephemera danica]
MALTGDGWIRNFLVTDPQRHRKGFTVYKVTSIVYPTASPEAITKVVVWKRYNDFKKLHRELQQRHQKLYLKDTFPPFCKSTLFGRFEEEVVEERRVSALRLLEFAAEHPPLFTSHVFVKFFESGYSMDSSRHEEQQAAMPYMDDAELFGDTVLPDPVLRPLRQTPRLASAESLEPDPILQGEHLFVGSWPGSEDLGCDDDGGHTSDSDSPLGGSPRKKQDPQRGGDLLQFFDPLSEESSRQSEDVTPDTSNAQLLSCLDNVSQDLMQLQAEDEVFVNTHPGGPRGSTDSCHGAGYIFEAACQGGSLARPASELGNYKVLGVLGRCMLVIDVSDPPDTQECFLLKAVYKSPCPVQPTADMIIPQDVPYMVALQRYHETENTIFMLLQHVSGGKLWDHLGAYINSGTSGVRDTPVGQRNLYLGQKLLPEPEVTNANLNMEDNCRAEDDLPPLAQDLTEQEEDVNMNHPDGCVSFVKDQNGINRARFSWTGLDTAELVQNAQKLLQSVSATLQRSENVLARSEKPSAVQYVPREGVKGAIAKCPSAEEGEEGRERRRSSNTARSKSSTGHLAHSRARLIERRYSCDDLLEGRGSLETGGSRRGYRGGNSLGLGPRPRLPEPTVRVWASQMIVALEVLHTYGLVFGDLRPDNVLLGPGGCAMLTFTGMWSGVDTVLDPEAATNLYAAPEVRGVTPISASADWWSLGALLYELITGKTLLSCHPGGIYSHTILYLPDWVSSEARSLLTELLKPDPYERLGSGSHGMENIKSHPFFNGVQWSAVRAAGLRQ